MSNLRITLPITNFLCHELLIYSPDVAENDRRPLFDTVNARLRVWGTREISFGRAYNVKARETRGDQTRKWAEGREGGWIGWSLYRAGFQR